MWWRKLGEVENEYTLHNFSLFAIFLSKIFKIGGHLPSSDKNNFAVFWDTVYNRSVNNFTTCLSQIDAECVPRWTQNEMIISDHIWPSALTLKEWKLFYYNWGMVPETDGNAQGLFSPRSRTNHLIRYFICRYRQSLSHNLAQIIDSQNQTKSD